MGEMAEYYLEQHIFDELEDAFRQKDQSRHFYWTTLKGEKYDLQL